MLGVYVGTLVHVSAATAGVSALLAASAAAFSLVKYVGAAYLVCRGCPPPPGSRAGARFRASE